MDEDGKAELLVAGFFLWLVLWAYISGEIVRIEASPWLWEALRNKQTVRSFVDQVIVVFSYSAFYLTGFLFPYWLTSIYLFWRRSEAGGSGYPGSLSDNQRFGRFCLSLSTLLLFLIFLEPIVTFVNRVCYDTWNGWMLLGLAMAVLFASLAYLAFFRLSD